MILSRTQSLFIQIRDRRRADDTLLKRSCFTGDFQGFNLWCEVKQCLSREGDSGKPGLKWKCGRGAMRSSEPFYTRTSSPRHSSAVSSHLLVKQTTQRVHVMFTSLQPQRSVLRTGKWTMVVRTTAVRLEMCLLNHFWFLVFCKHSDFPFTEQEVQSKLTQCPVNLYTNISRIRKQQLAGNQQTAHFYIHFFARRQRCSRENQPLNRCWC